MSLKNIIENVPTPSARESEAESIESLQARIVELEAENARLSQLDETCGRNARLFDALLRHSRDGFYLVTPQMTFLRLVHSALGNCEAEAVGRSLLSYIHPEEHESIETAFARLVSNPSQSVRCECRMTDGNGAWRWMEMEMADMLDDPSVQAIVVISRAIALRGS